MSIDLVWKRPPSPDRLGAPWRLVSLLVAALAAVLVPGVDEARGQDGSSAVEDLDPGRQVYEASCVRCHREGGRGVEGIFPSLRQNELIQGPAEPLLIVLLRGRAAMPGFGETLSNKEIAAVLSYLRSRWGNEAERIPVGEISAVRENLAVVEPEAQNGG